MKKFLLMLAFLVPFTSQAVWITWNIVGTAETNPEGQTVTDKYSLHGEGESADITMGAITKIAILDVTDRNNAEKIIVPKTQTQFNNRVIAIRDAVWQTNETQGSQNNGSLVTVEEVGGGLNFLAIPKEKYHADAKYVLAIISEDKNGNYKFFGSNVIAHDDSGWNEKGKPDTSWTPEWYQDKGEIKTGQGWAFAGPFLMPVPEPSVFAGILLGTVLMLSHRKKQA